MMGGDPEYDGIVIRKMSGTDVPSSFECSKPLFAEHLRVMAFYDQQERMGQPYLFVRGDEIVGYVILAASHLDPEDQKSVGVDTYGTVPALLITYMATHKRHERRGIGKLMVSWSVLKAKAISRSIGCRAVTVNSEPDVCEFYSKLGFARAAKQQDGGVTMYLDIGGDQATRSAARIRRGSGPR